MVLLSKRDPPYTTTMQQAGPNASNFVLAVFSFLSRLHVFFAELENDGDSSPLPRVRRKRLFLTIRHVSPFIFSYRASLEMLWYEFCSIY